MWGAEAPVLSQLRCAAVFPKTSTVSIKDTVRHLLASNRNYRESRTCVMSKGVTFRCYNGGVALTHKYIHKPDEWLLTVSFIWVSLVYFSMESCFIWKHLTVLNTHKFSSHDENSKQRHGNTRQSERPHYDVITDEDKNTTFYGRNFAISSQSTRKKRSTRLVYIINS